MYRGIIAISFCFLALMGKAQQTYTPSEIETKSYAWFLDSQWDSVITIIDYAHRQGIDYYYLQARLGAAWMAKGNYSKAEKAFAKALKFDPSSDYAQENLYYALLYQNEIDAARKVSAKFSNATQAKVGVKKVRALDYVLLDGGVKASTDDPPIGNINYSGLGLSHKLGRSFSLYHNFSYLVQDKYNATLKQSTYAILPRLQLSRSFSAIAGFHYLHQTFADSTYNDWAIAASVKKRIGIFDVMPLFSHSSLNSQKQMQMGIAVSYYPFGNTTLSGTSTFNFHFTRTRKYPVFKQSITGKVFKYLWLTGEFTYDDEIVRFFGDMPLTVNNSTDLNNYQFSLIGSIPFSQKLLGYTMFMKENKNLEDTGLTYKFNTLIIGLKFTL